VFPITLTVLGSIVIQYAVGDLHHIVLRDRYVILQGGSLTAAAPIGLLSNDDAASTAALVTAPTYGALQLAANGSFSYTPIAGFAGIDTFGYHASGAGGGSDANVLMYVVPVNVGASTTLWP
jgi:hypothetical protein